MLCYLAHVDFVNIGIDSRSSLIELFPFSRGVSSGCLECNLPPSVYRRIAERYSCGYLRKLSFIEKKVPTTIITSTVAASFAVSLGLRLGTAESAAAARRVYLDTISTSLTHTELGRTEGCACCGRLPSEPYLISSRAEIEDLPAEFGLDATVVTSEPILVSYRIVGRNHEHLILRNASAFDSSFPATLSEDPNSVELEIRDQFSIAELARRFAGHSMPCKFAIVTGRDRTVVCEFERKRHERGEGDYQNG
jgi:hypothetical protein